MQCQALESQDSPDSLEVDSGGNVESVFLNTLPQQASGQSPVGPDLHARCDGELALSLINSGW